MKILFLAPLLLVASAFAQQPQPSPQDQAQAQIDETNPAVLKERIGRLEAEAAVYYDRLEHISDFTTWVQLNQEKLKNQQALQAVLQNMAKPAAAAAKPAATPVPAKVPDKGPKAVPTAPVAPPK